MEVDTDSGSTEHPAGTDGSLAQLQACRTDLKLR